MRGTQLCLGSYSLFGSGSTRLGDKIVEILWCFVLIFTSIEKTNYLLSGRFESLSYH